MIKLCAHICKVRQAVMKLIKKTTPKQNTTKLLCYGKTMQCLLDCPAPLCCHTPLSAGCEARCYPVQKARGSSAWEAMPYLCKDKVKPV